MKGKNPIVLSASALPVPFLAAHACHGVSVLQLITSRKVLQVTRCYARDRHWHPDVGRCRQIHSFVVGLDYFLRTKIECERVDQSAVRRTCWCKAFPSGIYAWTLRPVFCVQDEPTSHLDMLSIGSLMACLQAYSGAIVLVSHDQHFVAGVASQVGAPSTFLDALQSSFELSRICPLPSLAYQLSIAVCFLKGRAILGYRVCCCCFVLVPFGLLWFLFSFPHPT